MVALLLFQTGTQLSQDVPEDVAAVPGASSALIVIVIVIVMELLFQTGSQLSQDVPGDIAAVPGAGSALIYGATTIISDGHTAEPGCPRGCSCCPRCRLCSDIWCHSSWPGYGLFPH